MTFRLEKMSHFFLNLSSLSFRRFTCIPLIKLQVFLADMLEAFLDFFRHKFASFKLF